MKCKGSPMLIVGVSLILLWVAGIVLIPYINTTLEKFGAQGGEMVQLQTSHVPTDSDLQEMEEERRQVKREIIDMTGYW